MAVRRPAPDEPRNAASDPQRAVHLLFFPGSGHAVTQANLTLHGLAGAQYFLAGTKPASQATEVFSVSPARGENHTLTAVVYTQKLTGVQWIELNDLTFADGTQWHASATSICRVSPNGFRLVAATTK